MVNLTPRPIYLRVRAGQTFRRREKSLTPTRNRTPGRPNRSLGAIPTTPLRLINGDTSNLNRAELKEGVCGLTSSDSTHAELDMGRL